MSQGAPDKQKCLQQLLKLLETITQSVKIYSFGKILLVVIITSIIIIIIIIIAALIIDSGGSRF